MVKEIENPYTVPCVLMGTIMVIIVLGASVSHISKHIDNVPLVRVPPIKCEEVINTTTLNVTDRTFMTVPSNVEIMCDDNVWLYNEYLGSKARVIDGLRAGTNTNGACIMRDVYTKCKVLTEWREE